MKKLMTFMMAMALVFMASAQETTIDYAQIPESAQKFITKDFGKANVVKTTLFKEGNETTYTVIFDDGRLIRFSKMGQWKEKNFKDDNQKRTLPSKHLPPAIDKYLKANYSANPAVILKKNPKGFEVTLKDGKVLKFDSNGTFVG